MVHFPNADADGFLNMWPKYVPAIKDSLQRDAIIVSTEWPDEIETFLALFKLLPAKSGKRTKSTVVSFNRVIEKFITHSEVRAIHTELQIFFNDFLQLFRFQSLAKKFCIKIFILSFTHVVQPKTVFRTT